jgi:hypothetical protein
LFTSQGSVQLLESNALNIGVATPASVQMVQSNGTTVASTATAVTGITVQQGSMNLRAGTKNSEVLSSTQAVSASGNVLVTASGGMDLKAALTSTAGNISLVATAGDVKLGVAGDITTSALGKTIDVQATLGAITLLASAGDEATLQTNAGNVRLSAATAGKNVSVGLVDTRSAAGRTGGGVTDQNTGGAVSVLAGGSVLDASNTPAVDVYAKSLRLEAGVGVLAPRPMRWKLKFKPWP